MDNFLSNLNDPSWWISVVIVGLIVGVVGSIAATYLVRALGARMAKASAWWRNRSAARRAEWQAEVQRLRDNPTERLHQEFAILRMYAQVIQLFIIFMIGAFFSVAEFFSLGWRLVWVGIASLVGLLAFALERRAVGRARQIREALEETRTSDTSSKDTSA